MQTNQLIELLATGAEPVHPHAATRSAATALALGAAASLLAVGTLYGVQPGLGGPAAVPLLLKVAYATLLGGVALSLTLALSRPGSDDRGWTLLALPVAALGGLAALQLASSPVAEWHQLVLGGSWTRCTARILALSVPVLAGLFVAIRRQAPTDLRLTGAAMGVVAGSAAALVYALACTESSPAFVLVWYSLHIAASGGLGAMLAPRALRW